VIISFHGNTTGTQTGGVAMIEATSCGGVVIFRGKILVLYKSYRNRYEGWVLPKGTVEDGEEYDQTALREVREETGAKAHIIQYIGKSQYSFSIPQNTVEKVVHWYLMRGESYYSKPQREEYFVDSGFYKFHEAYHLLKYASAANSDIARRFTDLFADVYHEESLDMRPQIVKAGEHFYEDKLVHRTAKGELVRSKSEAV
jgi:ADP-ribose pyrophosphatase YjhB (NUDIX family)